MAATNDDRAIPKGVWTEVTTADTTAIRIQNMSEAMVFIQATAGAAPTGATFAEQRKGSIRVRPWLGEVFTIADMFMGVTGANRIWAYAMIDCEISFSHT